MLVNKLLTKYFPFFTHKKKLTQKVCGIHVRFTAGIIKNHKECVPVLLLCVYLHVFQLWDGMGNQYPYWYRIYPFFWVMIYPIVVVITSWNYINIKSAMSSSQFTMNQKASGSQFVRMQNINWLQFRNEAQGRFRSQLFMAHNIVTRLQLNPASLIINWHIASDWKFSPPGHVIWWLNHVILLFSDWLCILSEVIRHYCASFATIFPGLEYWTPILTTYLFSTYSDIMILHY